MEENKMAMSRNELFMRLSALSFAAHDLNLFLDTHPMDQKALADYMKYVEQGKALRAQYEKEYGPICVMNTPDKLPWAWIESPWPWENQMEMMKGENKSYVEL